MYHDLASYGLCKIHSQQMLYRTAASGEEEGAHQEVYRARRRGTRRRYQRRSAPAGTAVSADAGLQQCPQEAAEAPAGGAPPGKRPY